MNKAEILASLSTLSVKERSEVMTQLIRLEEEEHGIGPSSEEARMLDRELVDYEAEPNEVAPWETVRARLRSRG
jgi:putative addiction module component (TIGR02574 family)